MRPKTIGLITMLLMAMLFSAAAISTWSDSTSGNSCGRHGDEQESQLQSFSVTPYAASIVQIQEPFSYFDYRRAYPLSPYHYQPFPYQCGPFPENLPYGPDERCVYPYYDPYPDAEVEAFAPGPPVSLSNEVMARWLAPRVIGIVWQGNPNGVTQVDFALLDNGRVVIHRTLAEAPPFTAAILVPYRAVSVRVRTYGLLQSVLQETIAPLPPR